MLEGRRVAPWAWQGATLGLAGDTHTQGGGAEQHAGCLHSLLLSAALAGSALGEEQVRAFSKFKVVLQTNNDQFCWTHFFLQHLEQLGSGTAERLVQSN